VSWLLRRCRSLNFFAFAHLLSRAKSDAGDQMGVDRLKEAKCLEREKSNSPEAPRPEPYPAQGGLTAPMRQAALAENDVQRMAAWAGQSAALARPEPAADFVRRIWAEAQA